MPIFERKFFFSKTLHFRRFIRISSQYCHSCVLNNFNILLVETNFPILNLIVCFPEDLNRNRKPDDYCMFASYCSRILRGISSFFAHAIPLASDYLYHA